MSIRTRLLIVAIPAAFLPVAAAEWIWGTPVPLGMSSLWGTAIGIGLVEIAFRSGRTD